MGIESLSFESALAELARCASEALGLSTSAHDFVLGRRLNASGAGDEWFVIFLRDRNMCFNSATNQIAALSNAFETFKSLNVKRLESMCGITR